MAESKVPLTVSAEPEKPIRQTDVRSRRSQKALRAALLRLVETRSFDKITLREIASEAGVSYPTFFNHYRDKQDLFQDVARGEIIGLLSAFREELESPDWRPGEGMCSYVLQRRGLWRTLLTAGASEAMRSEFIRRGVHLAPERELGHGAPIDLVSAVVASGTFEIIAWWLAQEEDHPASEVATMLETIVIEPALNLPRGYFTSRKGVTRS